MAAPADTSPFPDPPVFYTRYTDAAYKLKIAADDAPSLEPPAPPADGKWTSFGIERRLDELDETEKSEEGAKDAPSALRDLTKAMALNHLALLRTLSEHPGPQQSPEWIARVQSIHIILRELHERVNSYRGHQARGSLAKMLEVQIAERNEAAEKLKEARENVVKELEKVGVVLGNWLEARKGGKDMENG